MPILDAHHDLGHADNGDPAWSESYYFNGYSPGNGLGFFARIAMRPNEPFVDGFITLWLPDGRTLRVTEARASGLPDAGTPALSRLAATRVTAMRCWRLSASGSSDCGVPLALALTFNALTPPIGVDAGMKPGAAVTGALGSGHFEQAGHWQGECVIDGQRFRVEGRGNRDKSWGPRRSDHGAGLHYWRWFSLNFGDALHLGGIRVGAGETTTQRGWLYRAGDFISLRELIVQTAYASDGLAQSRVVLLARDKQGEQHRFTGEMLRTARLYARGHEHLAIVEGLTRWRHAGLEGYGICEYAHRLDAAGQAVIAPD